MSNCPVTVALLAIVPCCAEIVCVGCAVTCAVVCGVPAVPTACAVYVWYCFENAVGSTCTAEGGATAAAVGAAAVGAAAVGAVVPTPPVAITSGV